MQELLRLYQEHDVVSTTSDRMKRMHTESPPRKARKSLMTEISQIRVPTTSQKTKQASATLMPSIAPFKENVSQSQNMDVQSIQQMMFDQINAECEDLCSTNKKSLFRSTDTTSLQNWSYKDQEEELETKAPTFLKSLKAAAVNTTALEQTREGRQKRKNYASILPGIMSAAGTLLQCRNQNMTAHATITGLQLKTGGATKHTHTRLQARSLSVSYATTIKKQEMLGIGYDGKVKEWKKEAEEEVLALRGAKQNLRECEMKVDGNQAFTDLLHLQKSKKQVDAMQAKRHPGYLLVGDNIDFTINPRHHTTEHGRKGIHYFNFLAVKNKISGNEFADDGPIGDPSTTPLSTYLPNHEDNLNLRKEWGILIGQIITRMIPVFQQFKMCFPDHIDHKYSREAKQKSEVVGLGVITESENTNDGIAKILDHIQDYVPLGDTNEPVRTFSVGDQLTCERELNVQQGRRGSPVMERWGGLLPEIADFHALGNFYEWVFKQLYTDQSSGCRDIGTLFAAKTFWQLNNIPQKPLDNFYAVEDLIDRYVKTLVITATLDYFQMENVNAQPQQHSYNPQEVTPEDYMKSSVGHIIDEYAIIHEAQLPLAKQKIKCPAPDCPKSYTTRKGLQRHIASKHSDIPIQQATSANTENNATIADYCCTVCLLAFDFTDARRHGDGERIIRLYKFFTLHFKAANKHKYAYHCLRLQIQLQCLLTPRLAHQLTWNRFVNNKGGVDTNVELDRENEHRNKAIKEGCRGFHGKITDTSIKRVGQAAQIIENILKRADKEAQTRSASGQHNDVDASSDIFSLVDTLHQERVFDCEAQHRIHVLPDFKKDPFSHLDLTAIHSWMKNTVKTISEQKVFCNMKL